MRQIDPQARILLCSGSGPTPENRRLVEQGAARFPAKSFDAQELSSAVASIRAAR